SAALLVSLLQPPNPPPLLFIGCYQGEGEAAGPFLQALLAAELPGRREVAVETLSEVQARQLAAGLLGPADSRTQKLAASVGRESGGNPLLVRMLVEHMQDDGGSTETWPARGTALNTVLFQRMAALPEPARGVLEVLAVAGRPVPATAALAPPAGVAGLPQARL